MVILDWIPGIGHWRRGDRVMGSLLGFVFGTSLLLGLFRFTLIKGGIEYAIRFWTEGGIPFTTRHKDLFYSSCVLFAVLIGVTIFARWSLGNFKRLLAEREQGIRSEGQWQLIWRQFKRNRLAVVGAFMLTALYLMSCYAPFLTPYDPDKLGDILDKFKLPSAEHWLGTDKFDRDVLTRIIYGSRISLLVGFMAVGISVSIGTVYGAVAAYCRGWVESVMMRIVDMLLAFPTLILIITIIAVWKKQSIWVIIAIIGLTSWSGVARLVRGEFLVQMELEFFQSARALGASPFRLVFRHLLPNAMTPIIVSSTLRVGTTIIVEASLSFLGLGVQPPTPSWGNIVMDSRQNLTTEWWIPLAAGAAVVVTVVGYNLLGDGMRDALDPRLKN